MPLRMTAIFTGCRNNKVLVMKNAFLFLLAGLKSSPQASIRGDFAMKNVHTGKYVRIKDANGANGTPIVAYSPENWKCMTWEFQPNRPAICSNGCLLNSIRPYKATFSFAKYAAKNKFHG